MSISNLHRDFLQLSRLALSGRSQDIFVLLHKFVKKYKSLDGDFSQELLTLIKESPTLSSPLRKSAEIPMPVDMDSRLQLLKYDQTFDGHSLVLSDEIKNGFQQIIQEREKEALLIENGLFPTRTILFTGPPGVGKTMGAKWLANELSRPLLILDIAAVVSSYLGRTGNNIRHVLDYAKSNQCVLLLDEFDSIAKRRDDGAEIGELKRLVTVLLQEIDDWPSTGVLICATNHPDLLDPAVWRRFERIFEFGNPDKHQIEIFLNDLLKGVNVPKYWSKIFPYLMEGSSYSEIERVITNFKKNNIINDRGLEEMFSEYLKGKIPSRSAEKVELACHLMEISSFSQRQVSEMTGVSRDTIRKKLSLNYE